MPHVLAFLNILAGLYLLLAGLEELTRVFGFALVPLGEPVEMLRVLVRAMETK